MIPRRLVEDLQYLMDKWKYENNLIGGSDRKALINTSGENQDMLTAVCKDFRMIIYKELLNEITEIIYRE